MEIPQTWNYMTTPCYMLEGLLKAKRVQHAGHPILKWNVSNVEVKRDEAGRLRPVKPRVTGSQPDRRRGRVVDGTLRPGAPAGGGAGQTIPNDRFGRVGGWR
jgi:hypothetical protein